MAQTPEAKVKAAVRKILAEFGVYYFSPPANGYGKAGVPDIIVCVNGYFLAIECKANGNKPTELQKREISLIQKAGGFAIVVDENNIDDVRSTLSTMLTP